MLPRRSPTASFRMATTPVNDGDDADVPPMGVPKGMPPVAEQSWVALSKVHSM